MAARHGVKTAQATECSGAAKQDPRGSSARVRGAGLWRHVDGLHRGACAGEQCRAARPGACRSRPSFSRKDCTPSKNGGSKIAARRAELVDVVMRIAWTGFVDWIARGGW